MFDSNIEHRQREVLSGRDAVLILELIQNSLSCKSKAELRRLILRMKDLVDYDYAICVLALLDGINRIVAHEALNISYPSEWVERYMSKGYHQIDPIVKENFTLFDLQYWANTYKKYSPPREFLSAARDFGLGAGYTYGLRNHSEHTGSLFSFSKLKWENDERVKVILQHVVPHLHYSLSRIASDVTKNHSIFLSGREREILEWLREGKTSWEISVILNISERTVNFHIYNLLNKTGCVKRSQVVAAAIQLGLIGIE